MAIKRRPTGLAGWHAAPRADHRTRHWGEGLDGMTETTSAFRWRGRSATSALEGHDRLAPARGVIVGVALSIPLWPVPALVVWALWWALR